MLVAVARKQEREKTGNRTHDYFPALLELRVYCCVVRQKPSCKYQPFHATMPANLLQTLFHISTLLTCTGHTCGLLPPVMVALEVAEAFVPLLKGIIYHNPAVDGLQNAEAQDLGLELWMGAVTGGVLLMWLFLQPLGNRLLAALPPPHWPRQLS